MPAATAREAARAVTAAELADERLRWGAGQTTEPQRIALTVVDDHLDPRVARETLSDLGGDDRTTLDLGVRGIRPTEQRLERRMHHEGRAIGIGIGRDGA